MMNEPTKSRSRPTTEAWAKRHKISPDATPPEIEGDFEPIPLTAREIAVRAIILQGIVAVACDVDPEPVIDWFHEQRIWGVVSPKKRDFLFDPVQVAANDRNRFRWRMEAEWALLWVVSKVEWLGLPTRQCDSARLVDSIVPSLGSDIEPFLSSSVLRSRGVLLAEEDRHYDLWCRYIQDRKRGENFLPTDLLVDVLYQREYAFECLHGIESWDNVTCDA
jgi:hypothetical protein